MEEEVCRLLQEQGQVSGHTPTLTLLFQPRLTSSASDRTSRPKFTLQTYRVYAAGTGLLTTCSFLQVYTQYAAMLLLI